MRLSRAGRRCRGGPGKRQFRAGCNSAGGMVGPTQHELQVENPRPLVLQLRHRVVHTLRPSLNKVNIKEKTEIANLMGGRTLLSRSNAKQTSATFKKQSLRCLQSEYIVIP
jgi:hypothetical protein